MEFFNELRRRSVLRVGAAYLVAGWLILQFIDVVFPMLGLDEALGRPVLILLLIGLPIALLLAWTLELTPGGIKRDEDTDRDGGDRHYGRRRLDRIIVIFLTAALGLLLVERFVIHEAPESVDLAAAGTGNSLAVLPFVNLSGREEDEFFSDGLTETLLHLLAQVPELKVAARTSVFAFKGKDADVRDIAESLGVDNILEGSVQRSGDRVRITAQLIEAKYGFHLWSRSFDSDLDDMFAVQDQIATSVSWALRMTLLSDDGGASAQLAGFDVTDPVAYESYLRGLEQKNLASYSSLPRAESLFKNSLSRDADFVDAKLELANVYELQRETGLLTEEESERRVRPLMEQVLEARPNDGRAQGLLATIDWRRAVQSDGPDSDAATAAERALARALDLAPNEPTLYVAMSNVYAARSQSDESLAWIDKGLEVDPLSARLHLQRGQILLYTLDRAEEALEAFEAGRELAPGWTAVIFAAGRAELQLGNFGDGIAWYLKAMRVDPQDHELPAAVARYYFQLGMIDEGDRMYERARAIAPESAWVRGLELERQLRVDNFERAALLAEAIIRDDLENRGEAYSLAITGYVSSMIELGRADRVPPFLESVKPGIGSPRYQPNDTRDLLIQFMLAMALLQAGPDDTATAILESLTRHADRLAPGWRDDDDLMMTIAIAQGDREQAIERALADLGVPLVEQLDWELNYRHVAWVKPLLADKRIAARLAELDNEAEAAAEEVRAMLSAQSVDAD